MIKQFVTTGIMYKKETQQKQFNFVKIIDDPLLQRLANLLEIPV
jgi:hypothetical protein